QAYRVPGDVARDRAELGQASGPVALVRELADQGAILQHPVVVDGHGDEPDVPRERRVEQRAADVIEQAELRRAQPAIAREAALEEDALRHAVAGDELDVALEHGVIQRQPRDADRKSTRLNSSHGSISYAVFCLK